ncbi:gamma-aminobutyric acid receptor subunit beta-4-like [Atheta coriaria]|uniref:gamma-aminobutyric acid receptor subunit beta-4-like n=1 Tax=Dalotia coriaria TaxID=877792 RepID=UPI0031F3BC88
MGPIVWLMLTALICQSWTERQLNFTKDFLTKNIKFIRHPLLSPFSSKHQSVAINSSLKEKSDPLADLLRLGGYDKRVPPPVNGTLTVNVEIALLTLSHINRHSLNYEVDLILQQRWHDPRLAYNLIDEKNDYLNSIYHYGDIWLPDTNFVSVDYEESSPHVNLELTISPNGTVNYLMG